MTLINKLQVERFRGIRDLSITRLSQINLIVGNNNCGKTSLLEVIQFLRAPRNLANIYKIVNLREAILAYNANSVYDGFINMFPKDGEVLKIQLSGEYDGKSFSYVISGTQSRELLDPSTSTSSVQIIRDDTDVGEQKDLSSNRIFKNLEKQGDIALRELEKYLLIVQNINNVYSDNIQTSAGSREFNKARNTTEIDVFDGQIVFTLNDCPSSESIRLNRLSNITGTKLEANELVKISYVAPFEHLRGSNINQIIKDDQYKEKCLRVLQLFDPNIENMMLFQSDIGYNSVEYLKHKQLGNIPLSAYGDGLKKVLVLANAIIGVENGILLVDEIETAIHQQYYDRIFRFIVESCKEFNVQAFVTTHSLEAVDGLLNTQDYGTQDANDDITVVTLEREEGKTYSRVLPGRRVFNAREAFDFEVRL